MSRHIQWIGIKLPMSHPVLSAWYGKLPKRERDAVMAVEQAGLGMCAIPGAIAFEIGPAQGFSKTYRFSGKNRFTENMTPSDAAMIFRGRIREWETFRDMDYPPHQRKVAEYPSEALMSGLRVRNGNTGEVITVTPEQARIVSRLLAQADRMERPVILQEESGRSGALTSTAIAMLRKGRARR